MPRLALGTFLVLGCVPGCMVPVAYDVTQSSTIPLPTPTPPPSSRGVVDLYLGASTLTVAEPASDSGSSLYVPRTQLEGALSAHHSVMGWRILGGLSLGEGPSVGRTPLPRTSPPGFAGFGVDIGFFDENERFSLMVTPEVLAGFVTTAQEATPIYADGSRGASFRAGGTDMIMILGVQLSVGHWVLDWLRLLGGVGLRSSPNNLGRFVVEAQNSLLARDPASSVAFGDAVGLAWAGAELRFPIAPHVGGAVVLYVAWPFAGGPVTYGPIVSVGFRVTFGTLRGSSTLRRTTDAEEAE